MDLGCCLAENELVHSMMDLLDGLSKDCATLAYENDLGLDTEIKNIQIPDPMLQLSKKLDIEWQEWFMHGGRLPFAFCCFFGIKPFLAYPNMNFICLGKFTSDRQGVFTHNSFGERSELFLKSWDH